MSTLSVVSAVSGEAEQLGGNSGSPSIPWLVLAGLIIAFVVFVSKWHVYDRPDGRPIYVSALLLGVAVGIVALQVTFIFRDDLLELGDDLSERTRRNIELLLAWAAFVICGLTAYFLRKDADEEG